jgi:tRNA threonylcarbamoyladenosine modification (KEOPS) complex Cgi121 subunit
MKFVTVLGASSGNNFILIVQLDVVKVATISLSFNGAN